MNALIRCEGVYKKYSKGSKGIKEMFLSKNNSVKNDNYALKNICFSIKKGDSIGLLGHNGAGKSTLLSLILGVIQADKGVIEVNGTIVPVLDLGSGFHPELTGRENTLLFGSIHGVSISDMKKKFSFIHDFSELENSIDDPIRTYSKGMLARLGFSVAISIPGDVLLIDEVLAVGDINFQEKCINYLHSFREGGGSLIIVSHDENSIIELCDIGIVIDHGMVKYCGESSSAVDYYRAILNK